MMMNELEVNVGYEKEQKVLWNTGKKVRQDEPYVLYCASKLIEVRSDGELQNIFRDLRVILFTLQKEVDCQTFQGRR